MICGIFERGMLGILNRWEKLNNEPIYSYFLLADVRLSSKVLL